MTDFPFAYFDDTRQVVVLRTMNGTEIAELSATDAASLGRELAAAASGEDTGYEEFLAQERGDQPSYGEDEPDEQARADADDAALRLAEAAEPPVCILTGAEGENPDDCTTHDHEEPTTGEEHLLAATEADSDEDAEAHLLAASEAPEHEDDPLWAVYVRFIESAPDADAASGAVTQRLTGIHGVDEVWTETRYSD